MKWSYQPKRTRRDKALPKRKFIKKEQIIPVFRSSRNAKQKFQNKIRKMGKNRFKSEYVVSDSEEKEDQFNSKLQPKREAPRELSPEMRFEKRHKKNSFFECNEEKVNPPFIQNNNTSINFIWNGTLNQDTFADEQNENSFPKLFIDSLKNKKKNSLFFPSSKNDVFNTKNDLLNSRVNCSITQVNPFAQPSKEKNLFLPSNSPAPHLQPFLVSDNACADKSREKLFFENSEQSHYANLNEHNSKDVSGRFSSGFQSKSAKGFDPNTYDIEDNLYMLNERPYIKEVIFDKDLKNAAEGQKGSKPGEQNKLSSLLNPNLEMCESLAANSEKNSISKFANSERRKSKVDLNLFNLETRKIQTEERKLGGRKLPQQTRINHFMQLTPLDDIQKLISSKTENEGFEYINYINSTFNFDSEGEDLANAKWKSITQRFYHSKENRRYQTTSAFDFLNLFADQEAMASFNCSFSKSRQKNIFQDMFRLISESSQKTRKFLKNEKEKLIQFILNELEKNKLISHLKIVDLLRGDEDMTEGLAFLSGGLGLVDKATFSRFAEAFRRIQHKEASQNYIDKLMSNKQFRLLQKNLDQANFRQLLNEIMSNGSLENFQSKDSSSSKFGSVNLKFLSNKNHMVKNCKYISIKTLFNFTDHEAILNAEKIQKLYVCKFCAKKFTSGCALGGHISKKHKGLSRSYMKKVNQTKYTRTEKERNKIFNRFYQK